MRPVQARQIVPATGLPPLAKAVLAGTLGVSLLAAALSPNPDMVLLCTATLCLIVFLLWRENEPPILLLPALFQWSEVSIWAYATAWRGTPLSQQSIYGADLEASTLYGLLGVCALATGLFWGAREAKAGKRLP